MWKLITEPKVQVQKICNECGKVIETLDTTHPLTQYMIFDLQAHIPGKGVDFDKLDFGLQPYHWCPVTSDTPNCLIPTSTTIREEAEKEIQQQQQQQEKRRRIVGEHAPYTPPPPSPKKHVLPHHASKGRPPKTALEVIKKLSLEEVDKVLNKKDDSTNSV